MSAILALFQRNGVPVEAPVVEAMLAASRHRAVDGEDIWIQGPVGLAHQHFWVTPEEQGERQPLLAAEGRWAVTADVRLDNRPELVNTLEVDPFQGQQLSDAALILRAYERWGTDCVEHLLGDFAFALWDAGERNLLVARDALGARGLCTYLDKRVLLVASEVKQILAHPAVRPKINEAKIAEYLALLWENQEGTFYDGIFYCPPAHCLVVSADSSRRWRYWDLDPEVRIRYRSDEAYAEHFRELLTEAVRCRLRVNGPVGLSLSGGLDSTTLATLAATLLPRSGLNQERLSSFSYVFDELKSCDERSYIQPVVDRYGLEATYVPGDDKWTLRDIANWPVERDFVFHDAYAWLPVSVMRAAQQEGCKVLLSGLYGDLLYEGGQFWTADMLRDGRLGQMLSALWGKRVELNWRQEVLDHGLRQLVPWQLRDAYRRLRPRPVEWSNPGLHADLTARADLMQRSQAKRGWRRAARPDWWQRYRTLFNSTVSQGMATAAGMYHSHGLELAVPYLDRRLMAYVAALPADQLGRPYRSRWVLRNAMVGLLPDPVRERVGKTTFYALFEKGLRERERATVQSILRDPQIVRREFVRGEWLEQEVNSDGPWAAEGLYLWLCISLELWLRRFW